MKVDSYKSFSANIATENENVQHLVSFLDRDPTNDQQVESSASQATALQLVAQNNDQDGPRSNKKGFTPQEDAQILEEVRRNPNRRSTHKLFEEIAIKLKNHTGNSIRYRFRTHLISELQYVYEIDKNGKLILDEQGKPIKTKVFPSTVKTKFTADDDYTLCSSVRKHLNEKQVGGEAAKLNPTEVVLPGKFFEKLAEEKNLKHHTKAAWRDRYRKFAIPFGIDKYIEYYQAEKKAGNTPEAIKNFTGKHLPKSLKRERNVEGEVEKLIEHNKQYDQTNESQNKKPKPAPETLPAPEVQVQAPRDPNNIFDTAAHEQLAAISQATSYYESDAAAAVAAANKLNSSPVPEDFLTEDLVTAKFFEFQPLISVVDKISEIVNRSYQSDDAEQLISALYVEAGIQKKFGTFIITSVCGDLILIPKFVEIFLKTGENPPRHVHGIWTPQDDEYLKSEIPERLDYLRRLHGSKRIELRKSFISEEYA